MGHARGLFDEGWRVMGVRTPNRRAGNGRRGALTVASAAVLWSALAPHGWAAQGAPDPYSFAPGSAGVRGAEDTTGSVRLEAGHTYRSSIGPPGRGGRLYYRLELDADSTAYVSATAVPRPGASVSYADGLKVSLQDGDGRSCSPSGSAHFGATQSPHPIAASAARETGGKRYACQAAGTYFVVVERSGAGTSSGGASDRSPTADPSGSAARAWDLELAYVSEPGLRKAPAATRAPEAWDSASPEALTGTPRRRGGGAGFHGATPLGQGVWGDRVSPGETRFYKVPVDWGQQFHATAELGSSPGGDGYVGTALAVSLYNPVRGFVDDVGAGYDGRQRTAALASLPPVAYENRYALSDRVSGMRFAGSYYLVVHLAEQVADRFGDGPFGLTLRVRVSGSPRPGPAYAGRADPPDVFDAEAEAARAAGGRTGARAGDGGRLLMKLLAVGGIGAGSLLVLTLGAWTVAARRGPLPAYGLASTDAEADTAPASRRAVRNHEASRNG
ncbi:hypothetical protein ACGFS9_10025 [Streptomyces sp. NPDC048566]|uniref:hypothetical protein n=1 Tax=Streptomyces sp. NPDC048566 TaxID=3365569 RepID=UPI00371B1232